MLIQPSFKFWFIIVVLILLFGVIGCYDYDETNKFIADAKYRISDSSGTLLITDNYTIENGFIVVSNYSYWHVGGYGEVEHKILRISTSGITIEEY